MATDFETLGSVPRALFAVALLLVSSHSLGLLILPKIKFPASLAPGIRLCLGLHLLSALGVVLGAWGWLGDYRTGLLVLPCIAIAVSPHHRNLCWDVVTSFLRVCNRHRGLASLTIGLFMISLGPALSLPDGWDELVYHHTLPMRWHRDGRVQVYSDLPYSGFPSMMEVLFWWMTPVESWIAPRLLSWASWTAALVGLYHLLRRSLHPWSSFGCVASFAVSQAVLMIGQNCYVESMSFLDAVALLSWIHFSAFQVTTENRRQAFALGVFMAGASSIKLTGIFVTVGFAALVMVPRLWDSLRKSNSNVRDPLDSIHRGGLHAVHWGMLCLGMVTILAPHFGRPWMETGNPFYPYFDSWFVDDIARLETSRYHHEIGNAFGLKTWMGWATTPFLQSVMPELYDGGYGIQSLLFLALAGWAVVGGKRETPRQVGLAIACLYLYSVWFATSQQARFAIPLMVVLVVAASQRFACFQASKRKWGIVLLLGASAMSFPYPLVGFYASSWFSVLGLISKTAYVQEGTRGTYLEMTQYLKSLPENSRLVFCFEHRSMYAHHPSIIITPFFQSAVFTPPESRVSVEALQQFLRESNCTHVVLARGFLGPDFLESRQERMQQITRCVDTLLAEHKLKVVWESADYYVLQTDAFPR